jgi:hypothetical protein
MHQMIPGHNTISMLLERRDHARVEMAAAVMVPGKKALLHRFRIQRETIQVYEGRTI